MLAAVLAPFAGSGPLAPAASPALWVLAAAARRQFGPDQPGALASIATVQATSQPLAATAAPPNLPPMIGDNDFTLADRCESVSGAVTATVAASDPEGKKLTYSLTSGPAVGSLVFNKTTGVFTYTPTAAQRIQAALPGGVTPPPSP